MDKRQRHFIIKDVLLSTAITNQDELAAELKKRRIIVTQATLSRDLRELAVLRVPSEKGFRYTLTTTGDEQNMKPLIGLEVISIRANEVTIIIRTLPGRAPGVASFIDSLRIPEILGTIAGDDTVFVAPSSIQKMRKTMDTLKETMSH
ncbi:MAG: arginine repressor [Ignavibacteriales bacterium]|nr:arginine repressor [Ignavibacteriales bacterium]